MPTEPGERQRLVPAELPRKLENKQVQGSCSQSGEKGPQRSPAPLGLYTQNTPENVCFVLHSPNATHSSTELPSTGDTSPFLGLIKTICPWAMHRVKQQKYGAIQKTQKEHDLIQRNRWATTFSILLLPFCSLPCFRILRVEKMLKFVP